MTDSSNPFNNSYSQACTEAFSKFVPGFEFLQGLVKNAGQTMPNIGQWVAPTIDPQELERRIGELRTVQFWLEQNARMIATTVQALEVQRMTLGTLRTMNVPMADLSEALKIRVPDVFGAAAAAAAAAAAPAPARAPAPSPAPAPAPAPQAAEAEEAAAPAVDPMKWWGALTQQFTELATQTMQATSTAAAEAQARAAGAMQDVMSSVAAATAPAPAEEAAPEAPAAKKARRSTASAAAPAPAPASAPAAKKAARKTAAR